MRVYNDKILGIYNSTYYREILDINKNDALNSPMFDAL